MRKRHLLSKWISCRLFLIAQAIRQNGSEILLKFKFFRHSLKTAWVIVGDNTNKGEKRYELQARTQKD